MNPIIINLKTLNLTETVFSVVVDGDSFSSSVCRLCIYLFVAFLLCNFGFRSLWSSYMIFLHDLQYVCFSMIFSYFIHIGTNLVRTNGILFIDRIYHPEMDRSRFSLEDISTQSKIRQSIAEEANLVGKGWMETLYSLQEIRASTGWFAS